jgi:hypothetical protein
MRATIRASDLGSICSDNFLQENGLQTGCRSARTSRLHFRTRGDFAKSVIHGRSQR